MDEANSENQDPILPTGYSTAVVKDELEKPDFFIEFNSNVIKVFAIYMQIFWDENQQGKKINVRLLLESAATFSDTKNKNKFKYWTRYMATDLRELTYRKRNSVEKVFREYFKPIETERADIQTRIRIIELTEDYFSVIIHLNYKESYAKARQILAKRASLEDSDDSYIEIPRDFDLYLEKQTFEAIFEDIAIFHIYSLAKIFYEFLYKPKK
jgi:hypothetical protein